MSSDYTRSGARRAGDDYQDIVAVDVLVEMLEHPERYSYVEVEASQDALSLDDVVAVSPDGAVVAKQVKFSTDPSSDADPWTWADLLHRKEGKKGQLDSLLQKWHKSTIRLSAANASFVAEVVSNRLAGDDFRASLMSNGRVDFDKIPDDIKADVLQQIGDETEARWFFSLLFFRLDHLGLDVLEEAVRQRLQNLGGSEEGWDRLKNEMRHWVCHKTAPPPDGRIRLDDIKNAAKWRLLEGLPQGFEIPQDYVLPSQSFLDQIVSKVQSAKETCIVISGSPGVGKSTFLSYLHRHLRKNDVPVVRHHYFLSLTRQSIGRFDYRKIASSLMHDLAADYPEALGRLRSENPNVSDLGKWVTKCGAYFKSQSKCLVIIVDGLDHVWREKNSIDELNALLEHLLPVQEGIVVLLGTQPLAKEPNRLVAASPERLELPLLDKEAVRQWIQHHVTDVRLPANEFAAESALQAVADAFFAKAEGHPLHLTYTLRALVEQVMPVKPDSIEALPGCSHKDITTYYQQLWNALDEPGREILHLMAAAQFPWQSGWIIDCLDPNALNIPARNMALKQTRHLLMDRGLGLLPFHSSVIAYVQGLEDHALYSEHMKRQAVQWLQGKAPEYWRWAYEWILRADYGDTSAIASGPDKNWIVGSIAKAYPYLCAAEVLARAAWTCLGNDLPRSVELGMLNDYLYNTHQFRDDALDHRAIASNRRVWFLDMSCPMLPS